jgi:hypothetical protein
LFLIVTFMADLYWLWPLGLLQVGFGEFGRNFKVIIKFGINWFIIC